MARKGLQKEELITITGAFRIYEKTLLYIGFHGFAFDHLELELAFVVIGQV